jgi:hypothetical protein
MMKNISEMTKRNLLFLSLILLTALFPACKKERNQTMTIVRDCTGTYLRLEGKDYQVCNLEKVSSFSDGTLVTATFKKIKECNGSAKDAIVCLMLHPNEGWIEVEKVK